MSILDQIVQFTQHEVLVLKQHYAPLPKPLNRSTLDWLSHMRHTCQQPLSILAEIKKKSPSAGTLSTVLSLEERALVYAHAGVSMISVLVDSHYFGGSYEDLAQVRTALDLELISLSRRVPILCKGFILDSIQIDAAVHAGADAVLLIVRILEESTLMQLALYAEQQGIRPLFEVHTREELNRLCELFSTHHTPLCIGVNARDLATLQMNHAQALHVLDAIPKHHYAFAFSGVNTPASVHELAQRGVEINSQHRIINGVLIGEVLMREDNPIHVLQSMMQAAQATTIEIDVNLKT